MTSRSRSTSPAAGDQLGAVAERGASPVEGLDRQAASSSNPSALAGPVQPLEVVAERPEQLLRRLREVPARRHLLGDLRDVAEVRQEEPGPSPAQSEHHERVAAGEAGQPAHVDQRGDEQQVEPALAGVAAPGARGGRSLAPQFAAQPLERGAVALGALPADRRDAEVADHRDAAELLALPTSLRWTSTAGSAASSSASRIAHE